MLQICCWFLFCFLCLPRSNVIPLYSQLAETFLIFLGGCAVYAVGWVYYRHWVVAKSSSLILQIYVRFIWPISALIILDIDEIAISGVFLFMICSCGLSLLFSHRNFNVFQTMVRLDVSDLRRLELIAKQGNIVIYHLLYWALMMLLVMRSYWS